MLGILARADALIVRPPHAPAAQSRRPVPHHPARIVV